jgi:bacillithiol synthase
MTDFEILQSINAESLLPENHIYSSLKNGKCTIKDLFSWDQDEIKKRIEIADYPGTDHIGSLMTSLLDYNLKFGCSQKTIENIKSFENRKTFAVQTGHQPCFLTGPLYVIYKTIHCIKLSDKLNRSYPDYNFVPLFWISSEDHDLLEIHHFNTFNLLKEVKRVEIPFITNVPDCYTVGKIPIEWIDTNIGSLLSQYIFSTEYSSSLLTDLLIKSFDESKDLGDLFASLLTKLFTMYGLILFDPMKCQIHNLIRSFIEKTIANPLLPTKLLDTGGERVELFSKKRQIHKTSDKLLFFFLKDNIRYPITASGNEFFIGHNRIDRVDLEKSLFTDTRSFSPSAPIRPIFAEFLIPTIIYIGGPGEFAYHAMLKELYTYYGINQAIFILRTGATIAENRITKNMKEHDIDFIELKQKKLGIINKILLNINNGSCQPRFHDLKKRIDKDIEDFFTDVTIKEVLTKDQLTSNINRVNYQLDELYKILEKNLKRNNENLEKKISSTYNSLFPLDRLQERVINITYFMNKYGIDFIHDLFSALSIETGTHLVLGIK